MLKRVFVYGTLKKGFGNHRLLENAKYVGEAETVFPVYTMFDIGSFPGVVQGGETMIKGEVYDVNDEEFANLDRLEGYPSMYTREEIDTTKGKAWMYLWNYDTNNLGILTTGEW